MIMWTKFLNAGEYSGEHGQQRVKENMLSSERADPPPLYGLRKDHKQFDDPDIGPPTRPVCGAKAAHNGKLSHLISLILKEVKRQDEHACESTDDIMAAIGMVNKEYHVDSSNKLAVGSLDVKALYPSLDIPFAAKKVSEMYLKSNIEIESESINVFELGLYLVLKVDDEVLVTDGIRDYCPSRINTLGRKPNITGQSSATTEKKESMWYPAKYPEPDNRTMKKMVSKALEVGINAVMKTHVYKFAGETRTQKQGGAIGLELTGEIAGIFMSWWDDQMRMKLEQNNIKTVMYKRYVDDINLIVEVDEGTEDRELWNKIREIGDSIHESIQLEADYSDKYPDKKVPILDIKVWVDTEGRVMHEYYSKQVSSKAVVDAKSAMPFNDKRTILTQDVLRILLRCSPELPWSQKKKHIEEYVIRMQFSGYEEKIRKEIVRSALTAYERIKKKVEKKERPLYRTKQWKQKERLKEKRIKKMNWYKKNKRSISDDKNEYKSVLFVQPTRGSVLKRMYEDVIGKSRCSVRVVERAGRSICQKLQKSYPFPKSRCVGDECFVCMSEGKGNCLRENVNYEIECTREGCEYVYFGESARNCFCRGREHLKGISKRDPENVLVEHVMEMHNSEFECGVCCGFRMNVREVHTNAMERQLTEAVKIETSERPSLNRKSGNDVNRLPGQRNNCRMQ